MAEVVSGPLIAYPAKDRRGVWHAASNVAETALCGQPVLLDLDSGNGVLSFPGQTLIHPIVCKNCLTRWRLS